MAAPRPKKKTVKKAKAPTKADGFKRFKKMYEGGEVKMLANPPPMPGPAKAATVAKVVSRAAKDLRSTDPKSLRNEALRKANRAANQNKPKYKEKIGPNRPQGPEAPRYTEKIGPTRPAPSATSTTTSSAGARSLKSGTSGEKTSVSPTTGTGRPEFPSSNKSKKASVSPTTGTGRPEFPSSNKSKKSSGGAPFSKGKGTAALPKSSAGSTFPKGKGTAALPKVKSGPSNTAATSAASSGSSSTSKAAKAGVGRQTRYQRNETAMEQKRSSGKPKKSIFSLFRKG